MSDSPPASRHPEPPSAAERYGPRWAVIGIFILMLVSALAFARPFLVPVLLALLLALVFSPVRRFLERRGLPSVLASVVIVGSLVAFVVAAIAALSGPAITLVEDAPRLVDEIERKLLSVRGAADTLADAGAELTALAAGGAPAAVEVSVREPGLISRIVAVAPGVFAQLVFVLALLFFLLASGDMIYEKTVHVLPTLRDKKSAMRIARDIERRLSAYLFTITCINAALGATIGAAMAAFGMPNPLLFALLAFLLNYVPYIGPLTGLAIAVGIALIHMPDVTTAALVGAAYFATTSVFGQAVTPFFINRSLRLNTVVIFLSVAMCAWLWSFVGMLIATPLLVTVRTFCEHIPQLRSVGAFLAARGAESAELEPAPKPSD